MRVTIIFNYGRELYLDVEPMTQVRDLKHIIDSKLQFSLRDKILVYRGQFLEDDDPLQLYSIESGAKIYLKPLSLKEP